MEELINVLNAVPNSYFAFVAGIVTYANNSPDSIQKILDFIKNSNNPTTSDIVKFVMMQPDFHDCGISLQEKVG